MYNMRERDYLNIAFVDTSEAVFGIEGGVVVIIRRRSSGVRALHS